jgi:hypothetical protein
MNSSTKASTHGDGLTHVYQRKKVDKKMESYDQV